MGVLDALRVENGDMVYEFKGMRTMAVRAITPRVYMHQIWHLFRPREAHPNVSPSKPPKSSQKKINFWPRKILIPLRIVTNVTKCHKIEHKMTNIPKNYPHL